MLHIRAKFATTARDSELLVLLLILREAIDLRDYFLCCEFICTVTSRILREVALGTEEPAGRQ